MVLTQASPRRRILKIILSMPESFSFESLMKRLKEEGLDKASLVKRLVSLLAKNGALTQSKSDSGEVIYTVVR